MRLLKQTILYTFLFHCSVSAMETPQVPEFPEGLLLTHVTNHFPKNGIMIPSMTSDSTNECIDEKKQPNPRITLHWYAFDLLPPHESNSSAAARYVILERGKDVTTRLVGGMYEDLFMMGPHRLSQQSLAIVPSSELNDLQANNPGYRGTFLTYEMPHETIFQATSRVVKDYNLNPYNIKLVPKMALNPLTPEQARVAYEYLQSSRNTTGAKLFKKDNQYFLEEEVMPDQQVIAVNGQELNAKQFLTPLLPASFAWGAHSELNFGNFEQLTLRLFMPSLLVIKGIPCTPEFVQTVFPNRAEFIEAAKQFVGLYQQITSTKLISSYTDDEPLVIDFMAKWNNNLMVWYSIVQLQGNQWKIKPLGQTPYGNPGLYLEAIKDIPQKIQIFSSSSFLHSSSSANG